LGPEPAPGESRVMQSPKDTGLGSSEKKKEVSKGKRLL